MKMKFQNPKARENGECRSRRELKRIIKKQQKKILRKENDLA
jgi:hypothetical protein